jgi:hypothetical protein
MAQTFHAVSSGEGTFLVCEPSRAYSFAIVPQGSQFEFLKRDAAKAEADRLNELIKGGATIATRNIETPDRFEAVADRKYGPAWE